VTTTWRYAVSRERQPDGGECYAIREVYTDDESGALSWSVDAMTPSGESWLDLVADLTRMTGAISGHVLDLTLDPPALVKPRGLRGLPRVSAL
jgi:hypothetical protein